MRPRIYWCGRTQLIRHRGSLHGPECGYDELIAQMAQRVLFGRELEGRGHREAARCSGSSVRRTYSLVDVLVIPTAQIVEVMR